MSLGLTEISDLTGWKCRAMVAIPGKDPVLGPINITVTNSAGNRFIHFISRDTTRDWAPGDYLYTADVYNEGTGEGKELHGEVRVDEQAVI